MPAYKDKSTGKWFAQFYYSTYEGEKKLKKKRGFNLKREALQYEREFLEKQQFQPDMLLSSFIEIYKKDTYSQLREHTTIIKNQNFKLILKYFDNYRINQIKPKSVKRFQNKLIELNYSSGYIKKLHHELSTLFNHAIKFYGLKENPCRIVGLPKNPNEHKRKMRFWTFDDYQLIIKEITDIKAKTAIDLLYWTGMRRGELFALCWGDFNDNTLNINKSYQRLKGKDVITPTKTYENRELLLPKLISEELEFYKTKCVATEKDDRIFYNHANFLEKTIKTATEKVNEQIKIINNLNQESRPLIDRITVHGLRHSHASYLIQKGTNIVLISKRLGHKNIAMTLNTYSHFYPNDENKMIDLINSDIDLIPK